MILSDRGIKRLLGTGRMIIDPKPKVIQPASVDLHLSKDLMMFGYVNEENQVVYLDPREDTKMYDYKLKEGENYVLAPAGFILGSTIEKIRMPDNFVARVEGKSSLGRIGLTAHVTAGFIDPGFCGNITLELKNLNNIPIILRTGMPICQISFHRMDGPSEMWYGADGLGSKYQGSEGTVAARKERG